MTQTDAATPSSSSPATLSPAERASYVFLTVVTVVSLAADLITKGWAKARLSGFDPQKLRPSEIEVIKGHFSFIYALNPGGAWSFLRGLPDSLRRPFFLFVSASAIVFIISIYRRVPSGHKAMRWGLPLALGGAIGNLVDRIRYGSVIDFIDVYLTRGGREVHWPTFNVADIAIVVGVGLMVIDMLVPAPKPKETTANLTAPALAGGASGALDAAPALLSPPEPMFLETSAPAAPLADADPPGLFAAPQVAEPASPASEMGEPKTLPAGGSAASDDAAGPDAPPGPLA